MAGWPTETIKECLVPLSLSHVPKLPATSYRLKGKYPIVDQGQNLVAGWTDSSMGLISEVLPIVVFGDHTRALKYIDFPFVRGADGTQVLKPRSGIDPLYFYYACRAVDLPSRGYNRHFIALKESQIGLPNTEEQIEIGHVLRLIEGHHELQRRQLEAAQSLKTATMQALFTRGLRGEPQKETEIGLIPESWQAGRLDRYAKVISTRMSYTELEMAQPVSDPNCVKVLGVKVGDMNSPGNEIGLHNSELERLLPEPIAEQRCAPPRTIIFPKRGAAIATNKKRISHEWTAFDPNVIGVIGQEEIEQDYLFQWFQGFDLRSITEPGPTPQLNKKNLEPLMIPVPPTLSEQRDIASILGYIDRKIDLHRRKRAVLNDLFKNLLHKLMTGEIRVSQLDLSALSTAAPADVAA